MKTILTIFLCFLAFNTLPAQVIESAKGFGDWTNEETNGLAHDSQGNFYVVGFNSWGTSFDSFSFEDSGSYIVKFAPSGDVLWAKNIASSQSTAVDVAVDSNDNVYLLGAYHYDIKIDGKTLSGSNGNAANGDRTFVAKFDSNGALLFTKKIEISGSLPGSANAISIGIDSQNNFYLLGNASRSFKIDGSTYGDSDSYISFLAKFNPLGVIDFVKIIKPSSTGIMNLSDLITNEDGVFIVGYLQGNEMDFGGFIYNNNYYGPTAFVSKFDRNGTTEWVTTFQEGEASRFCSIVTDDDGNLYTLGNKISFESAYLYTHLITKLDSNGTILYIMRLDQEDDDLCNSIYSYGNKIGGLATYNNYLYYSGGFKGNFVSDDVNYDSANKNISILKFDPFGYTQWIKTIEGTRDDRATAISIYNNRFLVAGIYTSHQLDLDNNIINNNSGNNNSDIFVVTGTDTTSNICPQVSYTVQYKNDKLCQNNSDSIKLITLTESENITYYEWLKDGVVFQQGTEKKSIWVTEPGIYNVKLIVNSLCGVISNPIHIYTDCENTNTGQNAIVSICPNPASSSVYFKTSENFSFKVIIYNTLGQKVGQAESPETINIEHFANGAYWLKIMDNNNSFISSKKLLKITP